MKKILISLLSVLGLLHGCRDSEKALIAEILNDRANSLIIDTRSRGEYKAGHIEDAVNISHTEILREVSKYAESKEKKILLYCLSGARANVALKKLRSDGYLKLVNVGSYSRAKKLLN